MSAAIARELEIQKGFLSPEDTISSIYFGGGTPSLLDEGELALLLNTIHVNFNVEKGAEITLEANPDDLTPQLLKMLYNKGVNRLSIGIQSFDEKNLKFLNRAHNAVQAKDAFLLARSAGFTNITIDLIYAIPSENHRIWQSDLDTALALNPEHISSYCLTIEPKTVFGHRTRTGKMNPIDEEYAATQFEMLTAAMNNSGYEQYEISNFSKPGFYSRHNSNYWKQEKYLGVGPGAHSYNQLLRQYNCSNNGEYLRAIQKEIVPFELDILSNTAKINEYIMTSIRTKWGCNLEWLKENYQIDLKSIYGEYIRELVEKNLIVIKNNVMVLTDRGKLLADKITEDLFLT